MTKIEVAPYLSWLEEVVSVAKGLDSAEKQIVADALRALARAVRESRHPWHEHVFALAIAKFAFFATLPEHVRERMPICVCVEDGQIHAYITDSERSSFPLEEASIQLMPRNLLGFVETVEAFKADDWKSDEFLAAGHLADAQVHVLDEASALLQDILALVARCLYGMTPSDPA